MSSFVEIAAKLVADWKSIGFRDIRFLECRPCNLMSVQDFIDDGKTSDDYASFCRDHAGVIAIPDPPLILPYEFGDCEYLHVAFDEQKLFDDMKAEIRRRFGESTRIEHNQHTGEWYMSREFP